MIVYLENALGFFIQLFPCALITFLPFPNEDYRIKRRSIFIWMTVISVVASALFSAMLCLRDIEKYPYHTNITNLSLLAALLLILVAYICLVRETVMKKLLVFAVVVFYSVAVFVLVNMLDSIFRSTEYSGVYAYDGFYVFLYGIVTVLLLPLLLIVVIRPLREYIREIEPRNMRREFLIAIFSTLFYFCLEFYCSTIYGNPGGSGKWAAFSYQFLILLLMMLYQFLIYWLIFRESVRKKRDSERQQNMEIQQLQYEKIVGDIENTRRMRHDLHHHYNALNDMLNKGQIEEMKSYLSKVIDITVRRKNEVYCANMTVNGLLQYYTGLAADEDIRCEVHAQCGDMEIEPTDLSVLFGNTMENAICACGKCPENRWINIQIGTVQNSLAIEISNSCKSVHFNSRFQTENGFSPAEAFLSDRAGGGYGLRSISYIARKYGGSAMFRFDAEKETFITRIRLNIHKEI